MKTDSLTNQFVKEIDGYIERKKDNDLTEYWLRVRSFFLSESTFLSSAEEDYELSCVHLNQDNQRFAELIKNESGILVLAFDILSIFGDIISFNEISQHLELFLREKFGYDSAVLAVKRTGNMNFYPIWDFGIQKTLSRKNAGNIYNKIHGEDFLLKLENQATKFGKTYYLENANSCRLETKDEDPEQSLKWGDDDVLAICLHDQNESLFLFLDKKPDELRPNLNELTLLELLLTSAARAMRTSEVHEKTTLELKRNRFLFEITNLLNSDFEFQYCIDEILQKMHIAFDYLWVGFWVSDANDLDHLYVLSQAGITNDYFEGIKLKKGEAGGIVGLVAENGHFFILNEPSDAQREKVSLIEGANSQLAVPVIKNEEIFGVLDIRSTETNAFDQKTRRFARIVANQLAQSYSSRRNILRRQKELKIRRSIIDVGRVVSSILDLDILMKRSLDILLRTFNYWGAAIFLTNKSGRKLYLAEQAGEIRLKPEKNVFTTGKEGVIGIAASTKMITNIPDVHQFPFYIRGIDKVKSEIAIPIIKHNTVIGVLDVYSTEYNAFSSDDEEILELFANHLSVAISNARFHQGVQELAIRDGLTGLYNHRHLMESLSREAKIAVRYNKPLSLLMMDIDFFKKYNDTYGHPAGDKVLKKAAKAIISNIRADIDIPARYGGEEFAVILLETNPERAFKVAERMRKAFAEINFEGIDTKMTISIGVASYPDHTENPVELIEKADAALYKAKKAGRNRSITFNSGK